MSPKTRGNGKDGKKDQINISSEAEAKILCDEASGHLKAGHHKKALHSYNSRAVELYRIVGRKEGGDIPLHWNCHEAQAYVGSKRRAGRPLQSVVIVAPTSQV
uniref:Uncharacterized protein n=1 Tax=Timema monikensis TaxID=170555 RepID=A0A7R9E866_9NEOP|nr:unnamed protein product [Timema monikensis]